MMAGIEGIAERPAATLGLMTRKLWRFWYSVFLPSNKRAQITIAFAQTTLLLLAGMGTYFAIRRKRHIFALAAPIVGLTLTHTLLNATLRYSVPLLPQIMILAAYGMVLTSDHIDLFQDRSHSKTTPSPR